MTHPTDDEIMELAGSWFHTGENQKRDDGYYYRSLGTPSNVRGSDLIEFARALLAEQAKEAAEDASPPFGSKRAAALALYRPPFKFRMGYIHDAGGHMVADQDGFGEGSKVFDSIAARVRGWGRIGYMPDPEALQDEVGAIIADALTAYWSEAIRAAMAQERKA